MLKNALFSLLVAGCSLFVGNATVIANNDQRTTNNGTPAPANEHGQYRYLIEFAEPGLLARAERAPGGRFDARSPDALAARGRLITRQAGHRRAMAGAVGRALEVSHHYLVTHSGMATWLFPDEADAIARLPGVVSVEREKTYELATFRGPWFIGADAVWSGAAVPDGNGLRGEGMVIGVLDTGVQAAHPSFTNNPACGHGNGDVPDKLLSNLDCQTTDETGLCNGPAPADGVGHGSHVASTAAGNPLGPDTTPPPTPPAPFTEISGVAPCAHIRSYKVCPTNNCSGADIQAGMNGVLLHGDVDVMNFSISGGTQPWLDNDRRKLDLVDAGVFVVAAAGNTGSGISDPVGEVGHRGPWVLSVASITHDGIGGGLLSASAPGAPPDDVRNLVATRGSSSPAAPEITGLPIRYFDGQLPAGEGCTPGEDGVPEDMEPFPDGFFDGAAALIHRGLCPFATKIMNAFDAGAELVIVRNNEPGQIMMVTDGAPAVPAYGIEQEGGQALLDFVTANPDTATVDFEPIEGDVLSTFSLRGPTPAPYLHLTKPDVAAPGDLIYAAIPGGYGSAGGTSMASPHAAGAAALLRQTHADWTVSEVKSALMMTALPGGLKEDLLTPSDPDDVGSGRVDLNRAALAGLVMDETVANYLAADPASGGDVRTLNIPSVRDVDCTPNCSWTRTVRNTLDAPSNWNVGVQADNVHISVWPSSFSFVGDPDQTQELVITATPIGDQSAAIEFGEIVFVEANDLAPAQRITLAVSGEGDPTFALALEPDNAAMCIPQGGQAQVPVDVEVAAVGAYAGTVDLTAQDLPAGISGAPNPASVQVPGNSLWNLSVDATAAAGNHLISLSGDDGNEVKAVGMALRADEPLSGAPAPLTPADGAADISLRPLFTWTALPGTNAYRFQLAADAGFGDIVIDRLVPRDNFAPGDALALGTEHFWRVRGGNACGDGDWSEVRSFTTRLEPAAQITPNDFVFTVRPGEGGGGTVDIGNNGTGNLVWNIASAGAAAVAAATRSPLDETLRLPDFSIASLINGGSAVEFEVPGGVTSRGEVTSISFSGAASGISGNFSQASDTCIVVDSPGGAVFTAGGVHGTFGGCGERRWDFQGAASDDDGSYESFHGNAFLPPVADGGNWTFTFVNDWESVTAADIEWTDVAVTLHKTPWPFCDNPAEVDWLSVDTASGSVAEGASESIAVAVDSAGLEDGLHFAALCVATNDPDHQLVTIPVTLRVTSGTGEIFSDRFEDQ